MVWHKKGDFDAIEKAFKLQFPLKNQVAFLQNNGTSSASSYICKYFRKSINLDEDSELTKVCAWRSIWGLRAFQFFGVDNQITKWRELRRVKKDSSAIWKAANTGNFTAYLSLLKNNDTELLKEVAINKYDEEYKKVVGISVNDIAYKTHRSCELLTVSVDLNMVVVVLNYPRNDKKYSPKNEEVLTRINSPPTV